MKDDDLQKLKILTEEDGSAHYAERREQNEELARRCYRPATLPVRRNRRVWTVTAAALVLVACVGVGSYFALRPGGEDLYMDLSNVKTLDAEAAQAELGLTFVGGGSVSVYYVDEALTQAICAVYEEEGLRVTVIVRREYLDQIPRHEFYTDLNETLGGWNYRQMGNRTLCAAERQGALVWGEVSLEPAAAVSRLEAVLGAA